MHFLIMLWLMVDEEVKQGSAGNDVNRLPSTGLYSRVDKRSIGKTGRNQKELFNASHNHALQ